MQDEELLRLHRAVLDGMRADLADAAPAYKDADVIECGRILDSFLATIAAAGNAAEGRAAVRTAVVGLNRLNARCDHGLIETAGRVNICALMIRAGALRGFNRDDEDLSEQWREW